MAAIVRAGRKDLAHYDPEKGLKLIAVGESAEKHWARAKDPTQLKKAIKDKLTEQQKFVRWWDTQGPGQTPRQRDARGRLVETSTVSDLKPWKLIVHRWRRKLSTPELFEAALRAAFAKYPKILEFESIDPQLKSSESNEWYTPWLYVEAARRVLGGFDLDPASNPRANDTIAATAFYAITDNGLEKEWRGRVWLNPPYGGLSGPFAAKLLQHVVAGEVPAAVLLVNANSTDAGWFQPLWNYLLCFTDHRINFVSPVGAESGSTHGSVFVYFGPDRDRFIQEFTPFGAVVERAR